MGPTQPLFIGYVGHFPREKAAVAWNWPFSFIVHRDSEWEELLFCYSSMPPHRAQAQFYLYGIPRLHASPCCVSSSGLKYQVYKCQHWMSFHTSYSIKAVNIIPIKAQLIPLGIVKTCIRRIHKALNKNISFLSNNWCSLYGIKIFYYLLYTYSLYLIPQDGVYVRNYVVWKILFINYNDFWTKNNILYYSDMQNNSIL
jgi:hypothetical protein